MGLVAASLQAAPLVSCNIFLFFFFFLFTLRLFPVVNYIHSMDVLLLLLQLQLLPRLPYVFACFLRLRTSLIRAFPVGTLSNFWPHPCNIYKERGIYHEYLVYSVVYYMVSISCQIC